MDQFQASGSALDQHHVNVLVQAMASISDGAPVDVHELSQQDQRR